MENIVTAKVVGDWIGVSDRTVSDLAIRGFAVKVGRGKYDLKETIRLYTNHLREMSAGRGDGQALDLTAERARESKERADNLALKNAELRGELVSALDVEREWSDILRTTRAGILAVTSRVRSTAGLTAEQAVALDAELRLALKEIGNDQNYPAEGAEGADTADEGAAVTVD